MIKYAELMTNPLVLELWTILIPIAPLMTESTLVMPNTRPMVTTALDAFITKFSFDRSSSVYVESFDQPFLGGLLVPKAVFMIHKSRSHLLILKVFFSMDESHSEVLKLIC